MNTLEQIKLSPIGLVNTNVLVSSNSVMRAYIIKNQLVSKEADFYFPINNAKKIHHSESFGKVYFVYDPTQKDTKLSLINHFIF